MGSNVSSVHDVPSSVENKNGLVVEIESRRQWRSVFDSMKVSNKLVHIYKINIILVINIGYMLLHWFYSKLTKKLCWF